MENQEKRKGFGALLQKLNCIAVTGQLVTGAALVIGCVILRQNGYSSIENMDQSLSNVNVSSLGSYSEGLRNQNDYALGLLVFASIDMAVNLFNIVFWIVYVQHCKYDEKCMCWKWTNKLKTVLCTLRYIAKADFFSEVGDIHGVSKSSVSVCIPRVCQALCEHLQNIKFPSSVISLRKMKEQFYCIARFPNVVGAIDGTLIPIKGMSSDDEHIYVSRKNFHALNIQGVVDAEMRFLNINCRFPGSAHDAYIMSNSNIPGIMANLTEGGWLLGDSGYPLKDFLMTPFSNPSTQMEERYNHAHCQTRNVIERAFGVLKSRFRCLHKSGGCLPFTPTKCALVIETCCRLHNKAIEERIPLQQGGQVVLQHNNYVYGGAPLRSARDLRQHIASRF